MTCECECEERFYGEQKVLCESRVSTYWDSTTCQCKSKSVAPRGADTQEYDCYGPYRYGYTPSKDKYLFDILSYIVLGSCITSAIFLSATTFYYRRKYKQLLNCGSPGQQPEPTIRQQKPVWKHPNQSFRDTNGYKTSTTDRTSLHRPQPQFHLALHPSLESGGELYEDQYDEHGVRIERQVDDAELLRQYMG